jgi:hypothetical protein
VSTNGVRNETWYDTSEHEFIVEGCHCSIKVEVEGEPTTGVATMGAVAANAVVKEDDATETGLLVEASAHIICTVNVYAVFGVNPVAVQFGVEMP